MKKRVLLMFAALVTTTLLNAVTIQYGAGNLSSGVVQFLTLSAGTSNLQLSPGNWVSPSAQLSTGYYPKFMRLVTVTYPAYLPNQPTLVGVPVFITVPDFQNLSATGKCRFDGADFWVEGTKLNGQGRQPVVYPQPNGSATLLVTLDSLSPSPGVVTLRLYYGDLTTPSDGVATPPTSPFDSTSNNTTWTLDTFPTLLAYVQSPITAIDYHGAATNEQTQCLALGVTTSAPTLGFAVTTNSPTYVNVAADTVNPNEGFFGLALDDTLGFTSVSYGYGLLHPVGAVQAAVTWTAVNLYPDFQVAATVINGQPVDITTYSNQVGLISDYNYITPAIQYVSNVTNSVFGDGIGWVGQPLNSTFVTEVAWVANLHDLASLPYYGFNNTAFYGTTLTASGTYGGGPFLEFSVMAPIAVQNSYPVNVQTSAENGTYSPSGSWYSPAIDLGELPLGAGSVTVTGPALPQGTSITVATAASSDGINWSTFSSEVLPGAILPQVNSRYVRVRVTLYSTGASSPTVNGITLTYNDTLPSTKIFAYPNPIRPQFGDIAKIANIPYGNGVSVVIKDVTGDPVRTLSNASEFTQFGPYFTGLWDGHNSLGHLVAPGLYLYTVQDSTGKILGWGKIMVQEH